MENAEQKKFRGINQYKDTSLIPSTHENGYLNLIRTSDDKEKGAGYININGINYGVGIDAGSYDDNYEIINGNKEGDKS